MAEVLAVRDGLPGDRQRALPAGYAGGCDLAEKSGPGSDGPPTFRWTRPVLGR